MKSTKAELSLSFGTVKQRKESAEVYKSQGRDDLADEELYQASIIEAYLPEQMSPEELQAKVKEIIQQVGATSMKDMGRVMGTATGQLAGKADNKSISAIVRQLLG